MLIGYARVSTQAQSLDRQIGALNGAGVDRIFREKATAKTVKGRPQLEKAIDALGTDDVLVIAEWDRATRSMMDGITIIQRVADRGATVKVLDKPWLDLTSPMGKGCQLSFRDGPTVLCVVPEPNSALIKVNAATSHFEANATLASS